MKKLIMVLTLILMSVNVFAQWEKVVVPYDTFTERGGYTIYYYETTEVAIGYSEDYGFLIKSKLEFFDFKIDDNFNKYVWDFKIGIFNKDGKQIFKKKYNKLYIDKKDSSLIKIEPDDYLWEIMKNNEGKIKLYCPNMFKTSNPFYVEMPTPYNLR